MGKLFAGSISPLGILMISMFIGAIGITLIGIPLIMLGQRLARGPRMEVARAFAASLVGAIVGLLTFQVVFVVIDNTTLPITAYPLWLAALAGALVSFFFVIKFLDVDATKAFLAWAPYGIVLFSLLAMIRVQDNAWRENRGFYRGFEKIHSYNMINPPDAMSTPLRAVDYYMSQWSALRNANEDTGWGKILQTQTRFDARWFLQNDQWINEHFAKTDILGVGKVIQDPRAIRVMALGKLAMPVFGKPVSEHVLPDGENALVTTDEGQVIRLLREGPHWKVYGWLGHRFRMMETIYPTKKERNATSTEDETEAASSWKSYDEETRAMCGESGIAYTPADEFTEDERPRNNAADSSDPKDGVFRRNRPRRSLTGYLRLDAAKPGTLVDLSEDNPVDTYVAAKPTPRVVASAVTPTPQASPAPQQPQADPAQTPAATAATPVPTPAPAAPPSPTPVATATPAPTPVDPSASPTPVPLAFAMSEEPAIDNVSINILWTQYFAAVKKIQAGDVTGVKELMNCMSADDAKWLKSNAQMIVGLITPEASQYTQEQCQAIALQLLMRNMPTTPIPTIDIETKLRSSNGIAKLVDVSSPVKKTYTTLVKQENGRWVLLHPFFARTFIWTPQLAQAKKTLGFPLGTDEQIYMAGGFALLQQQVAAIYQSFGFGG